MSHVLMYLLLQEGPRTMVGIATFDSTIHFYNLKRALQQVNISCTSFYLKSNAWILRERCTLMQSHDFIRCGLCLIFFLFEPVRFLRFGIHELTLGEDLINLWLNSLSACMHTNTYLKSEDFMSNFLVGCKVFSG